MLLLIIFPLQNVLENINHSRISEFDLVVYNACQQARVKGYFTPEIISDIKTKLKDAFPALTDSDFVIVVTTTPKYRTDTYDNRERIEFDISVPIKKVIMASGLMGISDADNQYVHQQKGYVLSELPMP